MKLIHPGVQEQNQDLTALQGNSQIVDKLVLLWCSQLIDPLGYLAQRSSKCRELYNKEVNYKIGLAILSLIASREEN